MIRCLQIDLMVLVAPPYPYERPRSLFVSPRAILNRIWSDLYYCEDSQGSYDTAVSASSVHHEWLVCSDAGCSRFVMTAIHRPELTSAGVQYNSAVSISSGVRIARVLLICCFSTSNTIIWGKWVLWRIRIKT